MDMRHLINLVESELLDINPPVEQPLAVMGYGGLTFKKQEGGSAEGYMWVVYDEDQVIGAFAVDERPDTIVIHPEIEPEFQRRGYGTTMYNFAEKLAAKEGKTLSPAYIQTPAAKAFWAKRRPAE